MFKQINEKTRVCPVKIDDRINCGKEIGEKLSYKLWCQQKLQTIVESGSKASYSGSLRKL